MSEMNRRSFLAAAALAACAACPLGEALAATTDEPVVDVGALSDFGSDGIRDNWVRSHRLLLVRNEGRLYACTATCTHKGYPLSVEKDEITCAKHHSRFSIYGTVTKGPARYSLERYGISANSAGHVIVDKSKSFREKEWDDAGAFIAVAK